MRRSGERGQALLLVLVALGICPIGGIGLAIDVSQIYASRQMIQSAADGAAQAGIMSIFNGTNTGSNSYGGARHVCVTNTDPIAPCAFARYNGFGTSKSAWPRSPLLR